MFSTALSAGAKAFGVEALPAPGVCAHGVQVARGLPARQLAGRAPFKLSPLDAAHDRSAFRSDSEPLNRDLREQVTQDIRRRVAACFLALPDLRWTLFLPLATIPSR